MEFNSNPHNYQRKIGGLRPETLAVLILSVLVSALAYELIGVSGTILFVIINALGIIRIGDVTLAKYSYVRIIHKFAGSEGTLRRQLNVYTFNDATFISENKRIHLPIFIVSGNLIGISPEARQRVMSGVREMLNTLECDFSINIVPQRIRHDNTKERIESGYGKLVSISESESCYHVPVFVLSQKESGTQGSVEVNLITQLMKISGFLESIGLGWNLLKEDEAKDLFKQIPVSLNSGNADSIKYEAGKRFFRLNDSYCMALEISDFSAGPVWLLSQGLDSLDFPCYVELSTFSYEKDKAKRLLRYMISERSTDIKIQNKSTSVADSAALRQMRELNSVLNSIDNEGDGLVESSISMVFGAEDPTALSQRYHRVRALLDFLGLKYRPVEYYSESKIMKLLPLSGNRRKYMTSTGNLSEIVPLFFTRQNENGIMIGLNSATDKPEMFDFFGKNSFNVMVLGETGSGKSFFSKILLRRSLELKELEKILVIDPLEEYDPNFFGGAGRILNLSQGDYVEIPESENFDALNYIMALASRVIEISNEDLNRFRSIITSCLKDGEIRIRSVLERIKAELPGYSDEIDYAVRMHFRNPVDIDSGDNAATVIRLSTREQINREIQLLQMIATAYSWMSLDDKRKAVVIDEAHIMLEDESVTKIMDSLVRNSRHFNTGVLNITQNFSDFNRTEYSRNIINNTSEFFVFRSKTDGAEFRTLFGEMIPRDDFIITLKGGKNDRYSECVRILESRAYTIKVIGTQNEINELS